MRVVRLYGELGKRFGRIHRFAVNSPAEAIRALVANFPAFERYLMTADDSGVRFIVKNGNYRLQDEKEVQDPASGDIRIMPVLAGAGNGEFKVMIGAVLVVASFFVAGVTFGGGIALSAVLFNAGVGLILGGVSQMLTPVPKAPQPPEQPNNEPSYNFNGPVNTTAQGQPVPVGYGRLTVGGAIISAGISVEEIPS